MNDLIILATLLDGPKHGYQLKREAGFILGQGAMHNNLVYPLLRRFTAEGWVSKKTVPGERGQTRLQYAITALGRRELVARLSEFGESDASSFAGFMTRAGNVRSARNAGPRAHPQTAGKISARTGKRSWPGCGRVWTWGPTAEKWFAT